MQQPAGTWSLLLAGGEGRRLSALATDAAGRAVPKQYCSLHGGPSLLRYALQRARSVSGPDRICIVVAAEHQRWWWRLQQELPAANIVVQPRNRGTANGVLLQLLHVWQADPAAEIVLLPCDHFVGEEEVLAAAIKRALRQISAVPRRIVLLGMTPTVPDPGLGYIVAGDPDAEGIRKVDALIEKPTTAAAAALIERGALLNSFILAGRCTALLDLYARTQPQLLASMQWALRFRSDLSGELAALYDRLAIVDFSAHVLAMGCGPSLGVLAVPECGWTDLGTPERLGQALLQFEGAGWRTPGCGASPDTDVDLADNYWRALGRPIPAPRAEVP